jgi:hypothetical protein
MDVNENLLNVFQYWGQGLNAMPIFLKKIYKHNLDFCKKNNINLILIDDKNVNNYITSHVRFKKLAYNFKSDIIRYYILHKYGGFWFDTDVIIIKDLNNLRKYIDEKECMLDVEYDNKIGCASLFIKKQSRVSTFCVNYINNILNKNKTLDWNDIGPKTVKVLYKKYSSLILLNNHKTVKNGCNFICWKDNPGINKKNWYLKTEQDAKSKANLLKNNINCYYLITWTIYRINNMGSNLINMCLKDKRSVFSYFINYENEKIIINNSPDSEWNGEYVESNIMNNKNMIYKKDDKHHLYKHNNMWRLGEFNVKVHKVLGNKIENVIDLKLLLPIIVYFRSAKTGSSSIIKCIKNSKYKSLEIFNENFKINDENIIIVSVAAKPYTKIYRKIINKINSSLKNYISFGVVREPINKFISSYNYMYDQLSHKSISKLFKLVTKNPSILTQDIYSHVFRTQTDALYLDNKLVPQKLLYFDNLNLELENFFKKYNYNLKLNIHINKSKKHITKLTNDESILIKKYYKDDYKNFFNNSINKNEVSQKNYAVMWASTVNIGDDIQTLAAINFLKKKGITEYTFIDREKLSDYNGKPITMIMNGWYMHNINKFPPSNKIKPIFISVHINTPELIKRNISYFKKHEPIGCRDEATVKLFKKHGINAYFTGCLTLLFDDVKEKTGGKYLVDVNTKCKYIPNIEFDTSKYNDYESIEHDINIKMKLKDRLTMAENLLNKYRTAEKVITTRLHCILPCRAFNTNSIFIHKKYENDPRFQGLKNVINGDVKYNNNIHGSRDEIENIRKNLLLIDV